MRLYRGGLRRSRGAAMPPPGAAAATAPQGAVAVPSPGAAQARAPRARAGGLRRTLVMHAFISIVIPLLIAGATVVFLLTYHLDIIASNFERSRAALTRDIAGTDIRDRARNAARQIDTFLLERIVEAKAWASARVVVQAARAAHQMHLDRGLAGRSIDAIEARLAERKSFGFFPDADVYLLQRVDASPHFAEIFFTDRSGFNVALTNPTSDFVQSDEDWWQAAWSEHLAVGQVEYDKSAAAWSIDILVRIDEPGTGQPVGVMKAVLGISQVQALADDVARSLQEGRVVVAAKSGVLIAETESGHSPDRVMDARVNVLEGSNGASARSAALSADPTGFVADAEWITGYSRSGGRTTYAAVTKRFSGFDWIVLLQRPVSTVLNPLGALRAIESSLIDSRLYFIFGLGAVALVVIFFSFFHSSVIARRLGASLAAVRDMAERSARGEQVPPPAIEHPEEMVRMSESVHRLGQVLLAVLGRSRT